MYLRFILVTFFCVTQLGGYIYILGLEFSSRLLSTILCVIVLAQDSQKRVKLTDVTALTLNSGLYTTARRLSPIPQVTGLHLIDKRLGCFDLIFVSLATMCWW